MSTIEIVFLMLITATIAFGCGYVFCEQKAKAIVATIAAELVATRQMLEGFLAGEYTDKQVEPHD